MTITLIWPQTSWLKGVFPIHHYPCEETTISGPCLTCIKTHVLLPRLSLIHKHNSSTGVGGNIFFSLSSEGCYVWSVWGKCERTKVAGERYSACRRIRSLSKRKEEREALLQLCRSVQLNYAHICSSIDVEIWQSAKRAHESQFPLTFVQFTIPTCFNVRNLQMQNNVWLFFFPSNA